MKTLKYLKNSLFFLTIVTFLSGCSDSKKDFSADVDVIFVSKIIDGETMYGESYYADGNITMTDGTVTTPSGTTVQLDAYLNGYTLFKIPEDDSDYSSSYPTEGAYTFNITSNDGQTLTLTDDQSFYGLGFTLIDSMSYYGSYDGFYVSWDSVTGADSYFVCLYDTTGTLVFNSFAIAPDSPQFSVVTGYFGNWAESPVAGNKYTLQIQSIIYDDDATSSNYIYNVQETSYSDFEITWE